MRVSQTDESLPQPYDPARSAAVAQTGAPLPQPYEPARSAAAICISLCLCAVVGVNLVLEILQFSRLRSCNTSKVWPQKVAIAIVIVTFGASILMLYAGVESCNIETYTVGTFVVVGFGFLLSGVFFALQEPCPANARHRLSAYHAAHRNVWSYAAR